MLVLLHHANIFLHARLPAAPEISVNGASGVDIFFAISGFVMYITGAQVLAKGNPPGAWKKFLERRVLRVAPPYYALTLCKILLLLVVPGMAVGAHLMKWNSAASFLFLPSYNSQHAVLPVIPAGWTLNYEMLFYGLLSAMLAWRLPYLRSAAVVLICLAVLGLIIPHRWALSYLANPIELEFLGGMLIGSLAPRLRAVPFAAAMGLSVASVLALVLPRWQHNLEGGSERLLLWGLPGATLLVGVIALEQRVRFEDWRALLLLGDASYSLYLTHAFALPVVAAVFSRLHLPVRTTTVLYFGVAVAFAVAVAIVFHLFLEMPLYRRLSARRLPWSIRSAEGS